MLHCDRKLYLVFEYLDYDLKKYMDKTPNIHPEHVKVWVCVGVGCVCGLCVGGWGVWGWGWGLDVVVVCVGGWCVCVGGGVVGGECVFDRCIF